MTIITCIKRSLVVIVKKEIKKTFMTTKHNFKSCLIFQLLDHSVVQPEFALAVLATDHI